MAEDERAYQRQRRAYKALYRPAKLLMKGLLNYTYELGPRTEGPCLILSNHVTDFDPILVGLSFPEHMYYVAGENVMRMGFLSKVVTRYASVIQRIKGTTDAEAALQILRTLRKGRNVCMFAEGNRTFTGETLPIAPATAKLVKMSRSTLVTYRLTGFTPPAGAPIAARAVCTARLWASIPRGKSKRCLRRRSRPFWPGTSMRTPTIPRRRRLWPSGARPWPRPWRRLCTCAPNAVGSTLFTAKGIGSSATAASP